MFVSITRILPEMATPNPASYSNNSTANTGFCNYLTFEFQSGNAHVLDYEDYH
jgi:hypothetical protein